MKLLTRITPVFNTEEGYKIENAGYVDGAIIMLNSRELAIISLLQDACKGELSRYIEHITPSPNWNIDDIDMSDIFRLIYRFVKTKFAVNDFRDAIDKLDNLLMEGE